jgi:hypothetical protein
MRRKVHITSVGTPLKARAIDGMPDADQYTATTKSLALVGIEGDNLMTIMRTIVIGSSSWVALPLVRTMVTLNILLLLDSLSDLMGISVTDLTDALTERTKSVLVRFSRSLSNRPLPRTRVKHGPRRFITSSVARASMHQRHLLWNQWSFRYLRFRLIFVDKVQDSV